MLLIFTISLSLALAIDPFLTAFGTAFFDINPNRASITRLVLFSFLVVVSGLVIGAMVGTFFQKTWSQNAQWYAATSLFALSLKQLYSGFTVNKARLNTNPYHKAELISLSILQGINAFFGGVASGLMMMQGHHYFVVSGAIMLAIFSGYLMGIGQKKLFRIRTDFITGAIYLALAVYLVIV